MATRLSRIHPYPAMIADPLAEKLACQFVDSGMRVVDPFCGTSRTLLSAASIGAHCIGVDVNPLAYLITRAKAGEYDLEELREVRRSISKNKHVSKHAADKFDFHSGRRVRWFSQGAEQQLRSLICAVNLSSPSPSAKLLLAAILSATAREVSFCRKDRWKLHRLSRGNRDSFGLDAHRVFERRLCSTISELEARGSLRGSCTPVLGNSRDLGRHLRDAEGFGNFDLIVTSPPYGDSRTTVQYGGMSGICLGVVRYINGLENLAMSSATIDGSSLGGSGALPPETADSIHARFQYCWAGGRKNSQAKRVLMYLLDLEQVCVECAKLLRAGGLAVFVVGRRRAGGWRLYLDRFLEITFARFGLRLLKKEVRQIENKLLPDLVRPHSRLRTSSKKKYGTISTMTSEFVMVFQKPSVFH